MNDDDPVDPAHLSSSNSLAAGPGRMPARRRKAVKVRGALAPGIGKAAIMRAFRPVSYIGSLIQLRKPESMLQDVEAGREIELDAIVGAVQEIGRRLEMATPSIDALLGLARLFARSRRLYAEMRE